MGRYGSVLEGGGKRTEHLAQFTAKMQKAFTHFAKHRNKSEAYRYAYNCENMQDETIRIRAWELFEHPLVAAAVSAMKATAAATVKIDAAWVLKRAALLADFNLRSFLKIVDGKLYYDFAKATDDDWYCISELTMDEVDGMLKVDSTGEMALIPVTSIKIKAERKQAALKLVGDHVNVQAFKSQVEHTGAVAFTQLNAEEFKQARREMINEDDC
jgi:phage terminase small subunit